jgi:hypothetical protein
MVWDIDRTPDRHLTPYQERPTMYSLLTSHVGNIHVDWVPHCRKSTYVDRQRHTGLQQHFRGATLRMPQSSASCSRTMPGVIVRVGAGPEPGGPPNKEDITSPNGFAFAVRGGGISKYSVANSFSTYDSSN